ncbi:UDP-glucosyltransferase 29-like [Cornus florida]|uniref:UDP-glucosyltransferase 29-like n=1 Tax=Cornus florida TaxID=4283 RepID=UPI00289915B3|nr:UDP-glucosyltransferase 29-like [Cornus florida]
MEGRQSNTISVLMLPWLAYGHISPFLELAKALSKRNFNIYLCSTPVNLSSIKAKLTQKHSISIKLVELHLPTLPELPSHYHTTNGLPPHLMPTLKKAFDMAKPSFSTILKTLNPDLLIYDFLQHWAPEVALSHNIPATLFLSPSAAAGSFLLHFFKDPNSEFLYPAMYIRDHERIGMQGMLGASSNGVKDVLRFEECAKLSSEIILIKSFREIEGKYIDYLSVAYEKKMVPVGLLVQESIVEEEKTEIFEWLNKKDKGSTVFVSFGSEYFLCKEDMEEIANGLALSDVNFIWVVRFPMDEKIPVEAALPEGFLERVGERGMVVEGWAPQARILGHSNIGGFVSHCGWSSVMEGMKFGVPIIAIPMQLDQPMNARLVEEVGVGMEVKRDESGRLEREEVARVIKGVVVERNGEAVRRKAKELSESIREKGEEEIEGVVEELVKLCKNKKDELVTSNLRSDSTMKRLVWP